jgi:uncharacterized protein (TIGR02449 family)
MNDELQALQERLDRLLQGMERLARINEALRAELANCHQSRASLEQRISAASERVRSALARLPTDPADDRASGFDAPLAADDPLNRSN